MGNILLVCGLIAAGIWGLSLMKKIDDFLQGNTMDFQNKSAIILEEENEKEKDAEMSEKAIINKPNEPQDEEHILVCLSASPSNAQSVRTAACLAQAFNGNFTALYVETPDFAYMSKEDKNRLQVNISLAKQLGARI